MNHKMIVTHRQQEIPPWVFMVIGMIGFLIARGGITTELLCTATDTLRTMAMLGIVVVGCIMMLRDTTECAAFAPPAPPMPMPQAEPRMVSISAQQFKVLLGMAAANAIEMKQIPTAEPPAKETVAPKEAVQESEAVDEKKENDA